MLYIYNPDFKVLKVLYKPLKKYEEAKTLRAETYKVSALGHVSIQTSHLGAEGGETRMPVADSR